MPTVLKIEGDAVIFPLQYTHLFGQVFQENIDFYARYYLSGLLENNVTVVVPRPANGVDYAMVEWIREYIPARVVVAPHGDVVLAERAHFVTPLMKEAIAPCTTLFVHEYLLPRVRARLRRDPRFRWGNETIRNDTAASDAEWAATLPKKIMIIKQNKNARHQRAFNIGGAARRKFKEAGFVNVQDNLPFPHRLLLINSADMLVTTFGALLAMMMRLWGGWDRPAPLRTIVFMHPKYYGEKDWAWPFPCRYGIQGGAEVVVTSEATFSAANTWTKSIAMGENMDSELRDEHLVFEPEHCTLRFPNGTAPDFPSAALPRGPKTSGYFAIADHATRRFLPRYGACLDRQFRPHLLANRSNATSASAP
jgi:hypothetical protein